MLPFPTQDDKKNFPTGFVYSKKEKKKRKKKQTLMTANQHIFKSGLVSHFKQK